MTAGSDGARSGGGLGLGERLVAVAGPLGKRREPEPGGGRVAHAHERRQRLTLGVGVAAAGGEVRRGR